MEVTSYNRTIGQTIKFDRFHAQNKLTTQTMQTSFTDYKITCEECESYCKSKNQKYCAQKDVCCECTITGRCFLCIDRCQHEGWGMDQILEINS